MVVLNTIAVVLFLALAASVLKKNGRHIVILGWWTLMSIWAVTSCWYNDLGVENIELIRTTHTSLAATWLVGFNIVFLLGFGLVALLVGDRPLARVDYQATRQALDLSNLRLTVYLAILLAIAYLVYSFGTGGIPVLLGIDRLTYMREMAGPIERGIIMWSSVLAFILGYFKPRNSAWSISGTLLAVLIIFAVLISAKFSLIVQLLAFYFAPVVINRTAGENNRSFLRPRYLVLIAGAGLVLVTYAWSTYARKLDDSELALQLLQQRIMANQGQIWWAVHNDISAAGRYHDAHWQAEIEGVFESSTIAYGSVGMPYLMTHMLGKAHASKLFERGYLFTAAWPAILIVSVPYWLALLMQFLAGMLLFAILHYFYYTIRYRHTVRALIVLTVLFPYLAMLSSGYLANFFTLGMAVKVAVLFLLELGLHRKSHPPPANSEPRLDPSVGTTH